MLIIGDVAIKELNPKYNVKTVEIITAGRDITHLENVFNASIKSNKITEYAEEYRLKFDRKLLLYNCNKSAFLDDLLRHRYNMLYAPNILGVLTGKLH